ELCQTQRRSLASKYYYITAVKYFLVQSMQVSECEGQLSCRCMCICVRRFTDKKLQRSSCQVEGSKLHEHPVEAQKLLVNGSIFSLVVNHGSLAGVRGIESSNTCSSMLSRTRDCFQQL
ncbi:hypothetical protein L914_00458, partial [Phytophthora nicotianae]